jgi:hypothetical protein
MRLGPADLCVSQEKWAIANALNRSWPLAAARDLLDFWGRKRSFRNRKLRRRYDTDISRNVLAPEPVRKTYSTSGSGRRASCEFSFSRPVRITEVSHEVTTITVGHEP